MSDVSRQSRLLACYLLAAFLVFLPLHVLRAQSVTQTIQGLVTDATGAIIPGAEVTITNLGTGVIRTTRTNETGNYSFQLVEVGTYRVNCTKDGFRAEAVTGVRVSTAAQVRQDFTLAVGQITEVVEVLANEVTLDTENATVGQVIENRRIVELPLNNRNVTQLAVLVPGVQFGRRTGLDTGLGGYPIRGAGYSVSANGQRELHQVVSLDGVDAKSPRTHTTNFIPSIEAIEEFKIQTNAYSAEYGFGGGAVTSLTMKSGTNEIHGTLFEFLRNDRFDAENYFLNFERPAGEPRAEKDKLRRNQFGVVVSGPIKKNKTFWAFNWDARHERLETVATAWFPDDNLRSGDFSELLSGTINPESGKLFRAPILIYDPFTGDPFPNNIIPAGRIHSGSKNTIDQFLPRASFRQADPLDFTARGGVNQPIDTNQYYGRLDHYISDLDRVFGRIAVTRSSQDDNKLNPHFPSFTKATITNVATQWIHTFSSTMINEFRFGFNITDDSQEHPRTHDESFDIDALGIGLYRVFGDGQRKLNELERGVPDIMQFTIGDERPILAELNTFQPSNHVSLIKGSHNFKMGAEYYSIQMDRGVANLAFGQLRFGGNESGNDFASLLLGVPRETRSPEGLPFSYPRVGRFGAYFHDDWKATPRLTINYGLRFDYNGNSSDAFGRQRTLDFVGEGSDIGRGGGFTTADGRMIPTAFPEFVDERGAVKLWAQDVKFFMPRLGIAYRPGAKWVLRAGAGWFDNIMHQNNFTILSINPPLSGSLIFRSVTDRDRTESVVGADGRTYSVQTRGFRPGRDVLTLDDPFLLATGGQPLTRPVAFKHIKPDYKDGDVWKWSFDVQRELPWSTAVTVGYVGSKGTHIANSIGNFNNARPSPDTDVQSRRPFQQFFDPASPELGVQDLGSIRFLDSYGNAFHHGLQARVDKRYSKGLVFGLAYTYQKSHGDGENGGNEGVNFQDPLDRLGSRGRFRFDQTQMFIAHYVWEIPGSNLQGALRHVLGGWQTNGVFSLRTGFPFRVSGGSLNTGGGERPDRIADGRLDDPTRKRWYDTQAFLRVTCNIPERLDRCHFGSSGVNILDSPAQKNFDFSLFKNFSITEDVRVQFRSEFFNAFNTPYFGQPRGVSFRTIDSIVPDGSRDGEIRSLRAPMRIIQFGLKLFF